MTFDPNEILRRFHRALVREIQANNPEHLSAPFSVAEIYQNLVPYRTHRDEIGVEMNADYEHALLRLLAGEDDYLTIESRTARQEIREELESPNPNTGLYRDFAAADVRLNPERVDEALMWEPDPVGEAPEEEGEGGIAGGADPAPEPAGEGPSFTGEDEHEGRGPSDENETEEEEGWMETGESVRESAEDKDLVETVPEVDPEEVLVELSEEEIPAEIETDDDMEEQPSDDGSVPVKVEGLPPATCAWCREALPKRTGVNFCPFCGCSVHLVPCPDCGEELELNWRFCIACGTEVSS
ncbi:MAG: zinc ribbon domain-containing protein [Longimicrobiales bacterium]